MVTQVHKFFNRGWFFYSPPLLLLSFYLAVQVQLPLDCWFIIFFSGIQRVFNY